VQLLVAGCWFKVGDREAMPHNEPATSNQQPTLAAPSQTTRVMSKQQPNQDYYKIGGRQQTDGADRGEPVRDDKEQFAQIEKNAKHPAVQRSKKK
jgi:hypothetical protein